MAELIGRRTKAILALGTALVAMCLTVLIAPPPGAQAEGWTNYCNNQTLAGKGVGYYAWVCQGAPRTLNGLMGEGDQHSVCVWDLADTSAMCTTGPGAWVYNPGDSGWDLTNPIIENQASTATVVHAVAWTP
jgi:hypothetical protein